MEIYDFPAYENLAECTVKWYYTCPYYGVETPKCRLKHCGKNAYIRHQLWLPRGHESWFQAKAFDNSVYNNPPPKLLSKEEIFWLVNPINNGWGKSNNKNSKIQYNYDLVWWKKKSIFYHLKYLKHLLVQHQLDVMCIKINVCETICGTLLHIHGKSKDRLNRRMNLMEIKIKSIVVPQVKRNSNHTRFPPVCYTLTKQKKKKSKFCLVLKSIKVPTGYSLNIRNLVSKKDYKLQGLKSYDCHVLMQQLLPITVRCLLPKHVKEAIIMLCFFFNSLYAIVIDVTTLDELKKNLLETLYLKNVSPIPFLT